MDYMKIALKEARKAFEKDEVPVGAVIVKDGEIISKAYNQKESKKLATAHAEIIAIEKASKKLKTWHLDDCEMYVTLEPCEMCRSAIEQARISRVIIGAEDTKNKMANPDISIKYELDDNCSNILKEFFKSKRG